MSGFPAITPTSPPQASALLSNNAADKGLTNATPFDRLTNLEQVVANMLTDLPALMRLDRVNAITAFATGGQTNATALTGTVNRVTVCATIGDSVKLPTSVAGMQVTVINSGATGVDIFPATGDLIDTLAANTAIRVATGSSVTFNCAVAGTWISTQLRLPYAKFTTTAAASPLTAAAGDLSGAAVTNFTITTNGAFALTTRTATQMFNDTPNAKVGDAYLLSISNFGNNTVTITAGGGVTLTGTATIATLIVRYYIITFTTATALVMQNIGAGVAT